MALYNGKSGISAARIRRKNFRGDFGVFYLRPVGCENTDGKAEVQNTGMGLQVAVYETELVVRVRNFVAHEWAPNEYHFSL